MLRKHAFIASVFAALPLAGPVIGDAPAFTMYASSVEFRLDLVGRARSGTTKVIAPTSLASALPPSARPFVSGADHFRRTTEVTVLRRHLDDLARLSCRKDHSLVEVEITLFERTSGATKKSSARVACEP